MPSSLPTRFAVLVYGLLSYAVFFVTFLYAVGFIGNFGVPKTIDGAPVVPLADALLVNGLLLTLFAVQHSVMARPFFKRALARILPVAAERSTYVLASSLALIALFRFWQPMGGGVWSVEQPAARLLLQVGYGAGWLIVLGTTFLIHHFDLFGLRQVWLFFRGRDYTGLKFVTPGPYRLVRHPLYVGWLVTFWSTPQMTLAHLFFAVMTTAYILVAIQFEERDLADAHPEYHDYRRRTPMLVPRLRRDEAN
ncbi:methanethiol S-methyltransferase [Oleiharenicola sp. Vm1]|uniref:methanethiol S-methyltransferase n=1 Tax=Oleiharenicola sp. Vm1 TaxID=3398393 RepID=UPI0039F4B323